MVAFAPDPNRPIVVTVADLNQHLGKYAVVSYFEPGNEIKQTVRGRLVKVDSKTIEISPYERDAGLGCWFDQYMGSVSILKNLITGNIKVSNADFKR